MKIKIRSPLLFFIGVSILITSVMLGGKVGWVTDDYGITLAFFGIFIGLWYIAKNIEEEKKEKK